MPDDATPMITILLYTTIGLLLLLLVLTAWLSMRLGRIEKYLANFSLRPDTAPDSKVPAIETQPGGAFEAFLAEDPEHRKLPKGEQFAAYRRWRQEKGLNWSNS
jgi:hypothetical protein